MGIFHPYKNRGHLAVITFQPHPEIDAKAGGGDVEWTKVKEVDRKR